MADKEIVNLATAARLSDDILLPCYVPGSTDPAQKVSGAQIKEVCKGEKGEKGEDGTVAFDELTEEQKASLKGADGYNPVKGVDYWTEDDKTEIVEQVTQDVITEEMLQQVAALLGTPVFGTVDKDNNIILTGELTGSGYTVKYEKSDGELVTIGQIVNTSREVITLVWNYPYKLDSSTGAASADSANTYAYSDGIPFIDGTELCVSCSDRFNFHCHWYYYDADDNFVGKTDWMTSNTTGHEEMPETVIPRMDGAAVVKLRCNVVNAGEWTDLDRLTVVRYEV